MIGPPSPWRPDPCVDGFECRDLLLEASPEFGEPEGPLVATLIRRQVPESPGDGDVRRPAWLHVHGWNDYFFHAHLAEAVEAMGFRFYAIDLRRYGRSYREGQLFGYVADLDDYAEELDAAASVIAEEHDSLVAMGHSTGGLTVSLWAASRPGRLAGLALNSPWLDLHGPPAVASVLRAVLQQAGRRRPTMVVSVQNDDVGVYGRVTHVRHGGEWDYDVTLKQLAPREIRVGWLRAILAGHRRVASGLDIDCPIFVATSARTIWLQRYSPAAREADTVLDVDRIGAAATHLGRHLTLVRVEGGVHDLTLSAPPVRERFFTDLARWAHTYVLPPAGETSRPPAVAKKRQEATPGSWADDE